MSTREIPIYQIDAFTSQRFRGNPAAVCPLEEWLPDELLQAIAVENNLSETAYFVPDGDGYQLRWFTPGCEVELCGHATLASAYVLFEELGHRRESIRFRTRHRGWVSVSRDGDRLTLDFPASPARPVEMDPALSAALGAAPRELLRTRDTCLAVYPDRAAVEAIDPDMAGLLALGSHPYVVVTAPGSDEDFVSRFFAPAAGVPEDPVTGSAHCVLVPYWAERLEKADLFARQISRRGGELRCSLRGERVWISGSAVRYLKGTIWV